MTERFIPSEQRQQRRLFLKELKILPTTEERAEKSFNSPLLADITSRFQQMILYSGDFSKEYGARIEMGVDGLNFQDLAVGNKTSVTLPVSNMGKVVGDIHSHTGEGEVAFSHLDIATLIRRNTVDFNIVIGPSGKSSLAVKYGERVLPQLKLHSLLRSFQLEGIRFAQEEIPFRHIRLDVPFLRFFTQLTGASDYIGSPEDPKMARFRNYLIKEGVDKTLYNHFGIAVYEGYVGKPEYKRKSYDKDSVHERYQELKQMSK